MAKEVMDLLGDLVASNAQHSSTLNQLVDRNLTQGLGIVNTSIIHEKGSVSDDAGLAMALNTASRIPASGALPR